MNSCRHVLIPGEARCLACGERLLWIEPTRQQRFIAWVYRVADLLGYNSLEG
jgi:hypothetical protein